MLLGHQLLHPGRTEGVRFRHPNFCGMSVSGIAVAVMILPQSGKWLNIAGQGFRFIAVVVSFRHRQRDCWSKKGARANCEPILAIKPPVDPSKRIQRAVIWTVVCAWREQSADSVKSAERIQTSVIMPAEPGLPRPDRCTVFPRALIGKSADHTDPWQVVSRIVHVVDGDRQNNFGS